MMKVLVVLGIREDAAHITGLLKKAGINVFSLVDAIGERPDFKEPLTGDWFAAGGSNAEAVIGFSFTGASQASDALDLIARDNELRNNGFPLRGFVMTVEAYI